MTMLQARSKKISKKKPSQQSRRSEGNLQSNKPKNEIVDEVELQRYAYQRGKVSAQSILRLQRALGNQRVSELMQRYPMKQRGQVPGFIQRKLAPQPTKTEDDESVAATHSTQNDSDTRSDSIVQRESLFPSTISVIQRAEDSDEDDDIEEVDVAKDSKSVPDSASEKAQNLADAGMTGYSIFSKVKAFFQTLKGAKEEAAEGITAAMGPLTSILSVLGILWAINSVYGAYKQMKALATAKDSLANKKKLTADEKKVKQSSEYGYAKVRRRFWGTIYKLVSAIVKTVFHFITLLSGGTAAMVSEAGAMAQNIIDGLRVLYHKAKGFWKWIVGKRGVAREKNANQIVDAAVNRDQTALQLLVDLDSLGFAGRQMRALKHGYGDPPKPSNTKEMTQLLETFENSPEKFGTVDDFRKDTAIALKSQA